MSECYAGIGECLDHGKNKNLHPRGYARVRHEGKSQVLLHRVVYAKANNLDIKDLDGLVIRHRCDNTRCIRPDHLIPGTDADNKRDAIERNRAARGEHHGNAKLTDAAVRLCRAMYIPRSRTLGTHALARKFGVSQYVISQAIRGLSWSHLNEQ
ncbi:HNH endonuclease [Pseudomonas sp. MSSRFD41]|uniref:HNH endonuclease n=1 Tax=Pseudomonas sp. MSSRFD41 TaxID=1310370 RepID=UPI00163ADE07|nr:HNH endonuclease [Pseudomonas sp. MSSRFD41]MBC2655511.1 HNH endonuclease [Pseudomonas sp. MSSRFD41]